MSDPRSARFGSNDTDATVAANLWLVTVEPMPAKSKGHVAFIGDHEYMMVDGSLYRADVRQTMVNGARPGPTLGSQAGWGVCLESVEAGRRAAGKVRT